MSFLNKVVLITGAGSGYGEAIAVNFAKLSATLSLIDINGENLEKCANKCLNFNVGKVLKHVIDLTNDELVQKVVDDTVYEFGKIDVVVNCAGIYRDDHSTLLDPRVMENFDTVMAVNLRALVRMTTCAAPELVKTQGCVINISSVAAVMPTKNLFAYYVSKAGVSHFTTCAALELGPQGVRVNAILPGAARTNIFINGGKSVEDSDGLWDNCKDRSPLKKLTKLEDVANMGVYLASAESITGVNYIVDAGLTLVGLN